MFVLLAHVHVARSRRTKVYGYSCPFSLPVHVYIGSTSAVNALHAPTRSSWF